MKTLLLLLLGVAIANRAFAHELRHAVLQAFARAGASRSRLTALTATAAAMAR